eukprot:TRINITY_DN9461_c0_g4_i1.p4 TRINITY_DN9461_c0_g4~~TRINITY_DN9461_c0_g4_i1.p4  ORF type:complete len:101 (+),score=29.71 TRINITY_DN9461_c0_g4_i1:78-380(+)
MAAMDMNLSMLGNGQGGGQGLISFGGSSSSAPIKVHTDVGKVSTVAVKPGPVTQRHPCGGLVSSAAQLGKAAGKTRAKKDTAAMFSNGDEDTMGLPDMMS